MNLRPRTLVAALAALSMAPAWAAVIETHSYNNSNTNDYYNGLISATDLINAGQASLLSATKSGDFNESDGHGLAGTHDGIGQDGTTQNNTAFTYSNVVTLTYTLNTNAGTGGSASGYTITAVDVVAGWATAAKYSDQVWSVAVATVANPSVFNQLANVYYCPSEPEAPYGYTHVQLTDDTGALASGISAIQVVLAAHPAIISEIDVTGFATPVPEPAALVLLLAGLCGVGLRHRRAAGR